MSSMGNLTVKQDGVFRPIGQCIDAYFKVWGLAPDKDLPEGVIPMEKDPVKRARARKYLRRKYRRLHLKQMRYAARRGMKPRCARW